MMLTAKQEQFARNVAGGMTGTAAYRDAYDASNMSRGSIYVEASRLRAHPKVALRIDALFEARWEADSFDRGRWLDKSLQIIERAREAGNITAAIRGLAMVGKAIGAI